jgi:hypothetical protein
MISAILNKVFEHIVFARGIQTLYSQKCDLQYGFSEGQSPTMAALLVTETQAENKDLKQTTYIAALDVKKAFDTVWHESLFKKLFLAGVTSTWHVHKFLLKNITVKIKLLGQYSRPVCLQQGIGQGKILAAENYKVYINPLLCILRDAGIGAKIGPIYCGCPTCADDIVFLSNSDDELQVMFHIAVQYSREERYEIHPKKTKVIVKKHHQNAPDPTIMSTWTLGDTHIAPSDNCTHLGVDRYCNAITSDNFILDKVKLARRTAYSLMGAGFHGVNGLGLTTTREMTQLYVTPRLLYGLETLILNIKQREILEVYYRTLLRRLQSLPDTTAIEALYILAGVLPVEAQLDIKILHFFGKIANLEDSTLRQVALRQLATKELSSNSWFIYVTKIAYKYQLPSTHVMITNPVSESKWKKLVRCHVTNFWKIELQKSAAKKSSLKYLDTNNIQFKQPVHMWVHTLDMYQEPELEVDF